MTWMSTDIATSSGAVIWEGSEPRWLVRVWPNSTKSKWKLQLWAVTKRRGGFSAEIGKVYEFADDESAWMHVFSLTMCRYEAFIVEAVYGPGAASLAERRGSIMVYLGIRSGKVPMAKVRTQEWRGAAVHGTTAVWPEGREAKKKFAVHLAEEALGMVLPDDVADAYLIGRWFLTREAYENRDRTPKRVRGAAKPKRRGRGVRKGRSVVRHS
jgi:hypothetical protein